MLHARTLVDREHRLGARRRLINKTNASGRGWMRYQTAMFEDKCLSGPGTDRSCLSGPGKRVVKPRYEMAGNVHKRSILIGCRRCASEPRCTP